MQKFIIFYDLFIHVIHKKTIRFRDGPKICFGTLHPCVVWHVASWQELYRMIRIQFSLLLTFLPIRVFALIFAILGAKETIIFSDIFLFSKNKTISKGALWTILKSRWGMHWRDLQHLLQTAVENFSDRIEITRNF